MKKTLLFVAMMLCCATIFAQNNNRISYQAVVRDANNALVANKTVDVTVNIYNGAETTPSVFTETHQAQTNFNGMISLEIGGGTYVSGDWNAINWKIATVTTKVTKGNEVLGTLVMPLTAVPYALYADDISPDAVLIQALRNADTSLLDRLVADSAILKGLVDANLAAINNLRNADASLSQRITADSSDLKNNYYTKAQTYTQEEVNTKLADTSKYALKASLAPVATTGSYNSLTDKPNIPAAQVNADWNATSGVAQILNKPTIPTVPTNVSAFTNDAKYVSNASCETIDFCTLVEQMATLTTNMTNMLKTIDTLKAVIDSLEDVIDGLAPTPAPTTYDFSSVNVGDVIHVNDVITITETAAYETGGFSLAYWQSPFTLVRANVTLPAQPGLGEATVVESADGAYYIFKDKDGNYYGLYTDNLNACKATATSDGLVITQKTQVPPSNMPYTEYTIRFETHDPNAAPAGTTVTWDNTNVFTSNHRNDELSYFSTTPLTYEGITISGVISTYLTNFTPYERNFGQTTLYVREGDSFTFTAPTGKKFSRIEINGNLTNLSDANWSTQANGIVWSKTPSNTVTLACTGPWTQTDFDSVTSIVFTLEDE